MVKTINLPGEETILESKSARHQNKKVMDMLDAMYKHYIRNDKLFCRTCAKIAWDNDRFSEESDYSEDTLKFTKTKVRNVFDKVTQEVLGTMTDYVCQYGHGLTLQDIKRYVRPSVADISRGEFTEVNEDVGGSDE